MTEHCDIQTQSAEIGELAAAVAKMQSEIAGVEKTSQNPHLKNMYADLAACWDACHGPAAKNDIAIIQTTKSIDGKLSLVTTLAHSSGQWIRGYVPLLHESQKGINSMQSLGGAISYARRYGLSAAVGLAQIDSDGSDAGPPSDGEDPAASTQDRQCPACGSDVWHNPENDGQGKPVWKCKNNQCTGGGVNKKSGGKYPWASFDAVFPKPAGPPQKPEDPPSVKELKSLLVKSPIDHTSAEAVNAAIKHITGEHDGAWAFASEDNAKFVVDRVLSAQKDAEMPEDAIWVA